MERLVALEADLREQLARELAVVAEGKNSLFFETVEFNPHRLPEHLLPQSTAEMSNLAAEALALATDLEESTGAPVAALFRRYIARANNLADHHRPGPARLAREMLDELTAMGA